MSGADLQSLPWYELVDELYDQSARWQRRYNHADPLERVFARDPSLPLLDALVRDNTLLADTAYEVARRVLGKRTGALAHLHGDLWDDS